MTLQHARWAVGLLLAATATWSQALVFAVNDGATYKVSDADIRTRYAGLAADLSKLLKQPVTIEPVSAYSVLRKGLADKQYDLAFVHPTHISIEAINKSGYKLVAVTKGYQQYSANFIVRADASQKSLADLKGTKIGLPDQDSITAWMVRATLRDALGGENQVDYVYTRFQDAVPFFVENKLTKAGSTGSAAVVKAWQASGGKVLATSRAVPVKDIIASPTLPSDQVQLVRAYLLALDTSEEGKKKLEPMKFQGFASYSDADMTAIGKWLGL
ncbi:MAG TPA: phosphate/phosphite/phosphonate ABC transporter substrate-binding protein [Rhizobacter sp.]|nr:phosphate/phosphite/phosphonate ABC transporter substrate-binding protein [Rhizobacter sp.]